MAACPAAETDSTVACTAAAAAAAAAEAPGTGTAAAGAALGNAAVPENVAARKHFADRKKIACGHVADDMLVFTTCNSLT